MRALTRMVSGIKRPRKRPCKRPRKQPHLPCVLCEKPCSRRQELCRHIQTFHLPYCLYCPYSGCRWRGARADQFQGHKIKYHQSGELPAYQVYNVRMVLDWIKTAESIDFITVAQAWAIGLVQERANELGRDQWLDDPWGY